MTHPYTVLPCGSCQAVSPTAWEEARLTYAQGGLATRPIIIYTQEVSTWMESKVDNS